MALTTTQKNLYDSLVQQWIDDQLKSGNTSPRVTLAFASTAQVKTQTIAYVNAAKSAVQANIAAAAAERAVQDAKWTAQIADLDAIITELG